MHLVHPKSRPWSFVYQNGDMDDAHFKYYAWELAPRISSTSGQKTTTIVMAMPPWTLTPTDLQCFSACKEARIWAPRYGFGQLTLPYSFRFSVKVGALALKTMNAFGGRLVDPLPEPLLFPSECILQLYDICVSRDCPYFAVTNYYGWVFGVFSKGV